MYALIAVIVIVSVLGVMAAPSLLSTSRTSLPGAASMVQADIRYAQALAMTEGASKTVTFSSGSNSYTVASEVVELPSGVTVSNWPPCKRQYPNISFLSARWVIFAT